MKNAPVEHAAALVDLRQLIDRARQRAAVAVNTELTLLYWHIGKRLQKDVAGGERAEYGKQIIKTLNEAKKIKKPVAIIAHTILGKGVKFMENKYIWHGQAPSEAEAKRALAELQHAKL